MRTWLLSVVCIVSVTLIVGLVGVPFVGSAMAADDDTPIVERSDTGEELLFQVDCADPVNDTVEFEVGDYTAAVSGGEVRDGVCVYEYPLSSIAADSTITAATQNVTVTSVDPGTDRVDIRYVEFLGGAAVTGAEYDLEARTLGFEDGTTVPVSVDADDETERTNATIVVDEQTDRIRFDPQDVSDLPLLRSDVVLRTFPDGTPGSASSAPVDLTDVSAPKFSMGDQFEMHHPLLFDGVQYEVHAATEDPDGQYATIQSSTRTEDGGVLSIPDTVLFAETVTITVVEHEGATVFDAETSIADPEVHSVNGTEEGGVDVPDSIPVSESVDAVWVRGTDSVSMATDVAVDDGTIALPPEKLDQGSRHDVLLVTDGQIVRLEVAVEPATERIMSTPIVVLLSFVLGFGGIALGTGVSKASSFSPKIREPIAILVLFMGVIPFFAGIEVGQVPMELALVLAAILFSAGAAIFSASFTSNRAYVHLFFAVLVTVVFGVSLYYSPGVPAIATAIGVGGALVALGPILGRSIPIPIWAATSLVAIGVVAVTVGAYAYLADPLQIDRISPIVAGGVGGYFVGIGVAHRFLPNEQVQTPEIETHELTIRTVDKPTSKQVEFDGIVQLRGETDDPSTEDVRIEGGVGTVELPSGEWIVSCEQTQQSVDVDRDREIQIPLGRSELSVTVVDQQRDPIEDARVTISGSNYSKEKSTDTTGRVRFAVPAGTDQVRYDVTHRWYRNSGKTVSVKDENSVIQLLPEVRTIDVGVTLEGEAVEEIPVKIRGTSGLIAGSSETETTDDRGRARFANQWLGNAKCEALETGRHFSSDIEELGTTQQELTVRISFDFQLNEQQRNTAERLRDRIRSFDTKTWSDPTIPAYFVSAVGAFLEEIVSIPERGKLFFREEIDPDRVVTRGLDIVDDALDTIEAAMSTPQCVDFFAACSDLEAATVTWDGSPTVEGIVEFYHKSDEQRTDTLRDTRHETKSKITSELRTLSETAPAEELHSLIPDLFQDHRRSDDVSAAVAARLSIVLYDAIKDMFDEPEIRERMSRTVF